MSKIVNMKCISYNGTFPIQSSADSEFLPVELISTIHDNGVIALLRVKLNHEILTDLKIYMDSIYNADYDINAVRLIISNHDKTDGVIENYHLPIVNLISFNSRCRDYAIYALSKELKHMIGNALPLYVMDANNKLLGITSPAIMDNQLYDTFDMAIKALFEYNAGKGVVSCK